MKISTLIKNLKDRDPEADTGLVERAYAYAAAAHEGQERQSGEPYITHPLAAAATIVELGLPAPIVAATLLHDVPEDTDRTLDDIEKEFGKDIAMMVGGVTKLGKLKYRGVERYLESLRRMFVAMARDIRVILIKFADRLHNLETLDALPQPKRKRIAMETLEIYAPIAQRLGIGKLRGDLEDAAFRHALPKEYARVAELVQEPRKQKEKQVARLIKILQKELKRHPEISVRFVDGRAKYVYSLYKKLLTHAHDVSRIYDLVALRVVVKSVKDCYAILGIIHDRWKPMKGRIKDYIAQPKPNGYQSIHTTVFTQRAGIVEFQIRTEDMHREAEFGAAAHWHYKERVNPKKLTKQYDWIGDIVSRQKEFENPETYLDSLKIDVFKNQIFTFTPKGDVIELPEDATPIDFAYQIHSGLGDHCTGAKVNEKMERLDTKLKSGDLVEILTDKRRKKPSRDWLRFVKTSSARYHIKKALRP